MSFSDDANCKFKTKTERGFAALADEDENLGMELDGDGKADVLISETGNDTGGNNVGATHPAFHISLPQAESFLALPLWWSLEVFVIAG